MQFIVRIGSFPVASTHFCHSLVCVTHTHTHIRTKFHSCTSHTRHTLGLDTSLYTICPWIHSDVLFKPAQTHDSHCSRLSVILPSSSIPPSLPPPAPLYNSSHIHLFLSLSVKPPETTLDHASSRSVQVCGWLSLNQHLILILPF